MTIKSLEKKLQEIDSIIKRLNENINAKEKKKLLENLNEIDFDRILQGYKRRLQDNIYNDKMKERLVKIINTWDDLQLNIPNQDEVKQNYEQEILLDSNLKKQEELKVKEKEKAIAEKLQKEKDEIKQKELKQLELKQLEIDQAALKQKERIKMAKEQELKRKQDEMKEIELKEIAHKKQLKAKKEEEKLLKLKEQEAEFNKMRNLSNSSSSSINVNEAGRVIYIKGAEDIAKRISTAGNHLICCYFTMPGCRPCSMISPIYEEMARQYPKAIFLKCDIGENSNRMLAQQVNVQAFPTFIWLYQTKEVDRLRGANQNELHSKFTKHYQTSEAALQNTTQVKSVSSPKPTKDGVNNVIIKNLDESAFNVSFNPNNTVHDLKLKIAQKNGMPTLKQRLIFKGQILKDSDTLKNVGNNQVIHLAIGKEKIRSLVETLELVKSSNQDLFQVRKALELVIKYLVKIVKNPNEVKYRSIRLGNETFHKIIGSLKFGTSIFYSIGYLDDTKSSGPHISLPMKTPIEEIQHSVKQIVSIIAQLPKKISKEEEQQLKLLEIEREMDNNDPKINAICSKLQDLLKNNNNNLLLNHANFKSIVDILVKDTNLLTQLATATENINTKFLSALQQDETLMKEIKSTLVVQDSRLDDDEDSLADMYDD